MTPKPGRRPAGWRRDTIPLRAVFGLLVAVVGAASNGPASAGERYRVVVLKPPVVDEVTTDALARVRGELTAAGFDVLEIPQDPAQDVHDALETAGQDLAPIATFAIIRGAPGTGGAAVADIWVSDRLTGKSVIQNVHLERAASDPQRGAVVLAVQAVELLKASLAQYWLVPATTTARAETAPGPGAAATVATVPARAAETPLASAGLAAQAGVAWLDTLGPVGAVWEPLLRISYGSRGGWAGRLSVSGFGSDTALRNQFGSAVLEQQLGTLEALRSFRAGSQIQLILSAGVGGYRLRVTGIVAPPGTGTVSASWAALVSAGGGIAVPIFSRLALVLEAQALVTFPSTVVRIASVEAGRTGLPALLASGGLLGRF